MNSSIENKKDSYDLFLESIKTIAVVGASRKGNKFGNAIAKELKSKGFNVILIHPEVKEINGDECFSSLSQIAAQIDLVVVNVKQVYIEGIIKEAIEAGIKNIWIQTKISNETSGTLSLPDDVNLIAGKCILMYAGKVTGIHKFHKVVSSWFGNN